MRGLRENQQEVSYKNLLTQVAILDDYGNQTGNYRPVYGGVKTEKLCIAPATGDKNFDRFGTLIDYDRIATTSNTDCDIDEDSVMWLDGVDTEEPYNFIVIRKAPWKNSISYALREVKVSNA